MTKKLIIQGSFIVCYLFNSLLLFAQHNASPLTIAQIMEGDDFIGHQPYNFQWLKDSETLYFYWNPEQKPYDELYKVNVKVGAVNKVSVEEERSLPSASALYNASHNKKVYSKHGDIFLYDIKRKTSLQIINTATTERNPKFLLDDKKIVYRRGSNLFIWNQQDGSITQVSNFKIGNPPRSFHPSRQDEWLQNDQYAIFEVLKKQKSNKQAQGEYKKQFKPKRPLPIYLGNKELYKADLSPDGKYIFYTLRKRNGYQPTHITEYVTQSGYTALQKARSKVGSSQDTFTTGIYDIEKDTTYMIDIEQIEGIFDKPEYLKIYHNDKNGEYCDKYDTPREVFIHAPIYSADGKKAVVDVRSMDNKDRWIMLLDLSKAELSLLDRQHDEAWVGGPGISGWNLYSGEIGWTGKKVWYQSEASGYSHLYTIDTETKEKKQLTLGDFEILSVKVSQDNKHFYVSSNKEGAGEHHLYKLKTEGGEMTKITSQEGANEVVLSPNEKYIAIRHSYANKPWELYLQNNKPSAQPKQITSSTTKQFDAYSWKIPDFITFKAEDGQNVHARLYKPNKATEGGKAVIFVHGAGYLQNAHKWWSTYYREYMFHNFLVDNGYTVLDIDYRGSAGYGREWRTGVYRFMGGKDLSDQIDGAKYLVEKHGISPERLGIYGGSYGGFITLMAMFTKPDVFKAGSALRSVTDWAHYNHGYTSNILNTPSEDSIAYRRSSPIYHAEGLKGRLLIQHGMVDDNVQFQDVVRLSQRLIELGKENWEMAIFPVEPHGFKKASSWTDEYKRIYKLFEDELNHKGQ